MTVYEELRTRFGSHTKLNRAIYEYYFKGIIPVGFEDLDWEEIIYTQHNHYISHIFAVLERNHG